MQPFLTDEEQEQMLKEAEFTEPEFHSDDEYNQYYAEKWMQYKLEEERRLEPHTTPLTEADLKELDELYTEYQVNRGLHNLHQQDRNSSFFPTKSTRMEAE